jgi:hypothetical protein
MKSSDLKVVAIILSIALFFTIITSNAVSIASVVILAKGGSGATVQAGTQQGTVQQGTATTPGGTTSTTPGGTVSTTPDAGTQTTPGGTTSTTPGGTTATTPDGTTQQGGTTQTTPDANKPADNAGNADASNDPILKDPLGAYQKAAKEINQKGAAGYTKKGWQVVEGELALNKAQFLAGTLTDIIKGFMTDEASAEEKVNAKGSDDAKNRMPPSDCDKKYVKSATAKKEGDLYIITIVMNDQVNPSYQDADGLVKMSKEFLDINDVKKTVTEDPTVSKVVSKLDGTINYKAYTITATMNSKGQFVDITHYGVGDIKADLTAMGTDLSASGALSFNAKYYNFQY